MAPRVSPEYTPYTTVKPEGPRMVAERLDISFPEVKFSNAMGRAMEVAGGGMQALAGAQGAVAHAFDNLGTQLEKTGNQLWDRAQGLQELQNQNALSKAELEFDKYVATKQSQFENLKGEAATEETYKAFIKDLEDQQKKLGAKLPPNTQKQFNASTLNQIGKRGIAAAGHVASEIRDVTIKTSEARVNQWKDELSKNRDINENKNIIEKIEKEILTTQMPAKGWSPEIAREAVRKHVGEGYAGQLRDLARTDPWQAERILDHPENRGMWDDKQYNALKQHILERQSYITSRNTANKVQNDNPDEDLEKKLEKGDKEVEKLSEKLPEVKEQTRQAIKERHHTHNEAVAEERRKNIQTLDAVLSGNGENANGNRPGDEDELFTFGGQKARDAYEKLNGTDKKRVQRELNINKMGLFQPTPESEERFQMYKGMRGNDPGQFKNLDLDADRNLRLDDKRKLQTMQDQLRKEGIKLEADPHASRAFAIAKSEGFIDRKILDSKSKLDLYRGVFSDAIHAIQKQQGYDKPLTVEQIKQITNMIEHGETSIGKLFGFGYKVVKEGDPLYKTMKEVPEGTRAEILKSHPGISEEEILERYRRAKLQLEWEKMRAPKYAY